MTADLRALHRIDLAPRVIRPGEGPWIPIPRGVRLTRSMRCGTLGRAHRASDLRVSSGAWALGVLVPWREAETMS